MSNPCECTRSASALSPAGYLIALLDFVGEYYSIDSSTLLSRMHRPRLATEGVSSDLIDNPVPQITIAIDVLVEYIKKKLNIDEATVYHKLATSINPPPFYYEGARFREYLTILGTSLDKIHEVFTDPDSGAITHERLAEFIGIINDELSYITSPQDHTNTAKLLGVDWVDVQNALDNNDAAGVADLLNVTNEELIALLSLKIVGANEDIGNVDDAKFDLLRRVVGLTNIFGITINDSVGLLDLITSTDITKTVVEKLYTTLLIGNEFGLSGVELSELIKEKDDASLLDVLDLSNQAALDALKAPSHPNAHQLAEIFGVDDEDIITILSFVGVGISPITINTNVQLNKLYRLSQLRKFTDTPAVNLVRLMKDMNPELGDINTLENFIKVWKRIHTAQSSGIDLEKFVHLKIAFEQAQLADYLGVEKTELDGLVATAGDPVQDQKLANMFGLAVEDLQILYSLGIKDGTTDLNDATDISSINRLELLYRPLRLAHALNINITELKAILSSLRPAVADANRISYEQILEMREIVYLCRLFGLDIAALSKLTKAAADLTELKRYLDITDVDWNAYLALASDQEKIAALALLLDVTVEDLEELVSSLGSNLTNYLDIDILRRYSGISEQLGMTPQELKDLTDSLPPAGTLNITVIDSYLRVFALVAGRENLNDLITEISWLANFVDINSYKRAYCLYRINSLANTLDLSIQGLKNLNKWEHQIQSSDVAALLLKIEERFEKKQYEKEIKKPNERIWLKTREALIKYAFSKVILDTSPDTPDTIKKLSDYLLIDLAYAPCNMTTEIQQAIESVQTFVIRARTGKENVVVLAEAKERMEEEWRWVRRYVLWEAAQKVFLYPENYIMPQLRDNKSSFFNELEDELSQGEVTESLAEKAIAGYIEKLNSISALRVSGTVYDKETKTLHIFARSQINDRGTYYRTFKRQTIWSPWTKLGAEINADRVYPFIAYNRIYLFWIETEEEQKDDNTIYKHKLFYSHTMEAGKWSKPQSHELSGSLSTKPDPLIGVEKKADNINIVVFHPSDIGDLSNAYKLACNNVLEESSYRSLSWGSYQILYFREYEPRVSDIIPDGTGFLEIKKYSHYSETEINCYTEINGELLSMSWKGKYASHFYPHILILIHESKLKFISFVLGEDPYEYNPYFQHYEIINDINLLTNIDVDTLRVDDAIKVDDNCYYFCSDQFRCFMIVVNVYYDVYRTFKAKFSICQLNYGKYCELADKLFQKGTDALYDPVFQTSDLGPDFKNIYTPDETAVVCYPSTKFDFRGPNKIYNRELFFHIPHLIADNLNQNRKFEAAQDWYLYIFNPYSESPGAEWHFLPFRDDPVDQLLDYIHDPEDAAIWVENPYNPHAVARVRPGGYQKAIVLAYIDNLLDWADQEFTRDTRDSINRAIGFYNTAKRLLSLREIEHEESCSLLLKELKVTIRRAVPRTRAVELLDKLGKIGGLSKEKAEELYETIGEIAGSIYSKNIRADIIEAFLDNAINELNSLPKLPLPDIMAEMDDEVDSIMANAEDYINSVPEDATACVCIPNEWLSAEDLELPPIRLLASSTVGCIPENSLYQNYRNHIESNLSKIHSCRNIAGVQRILPMYEASVDPMAIVKAVGSGAGLDALNFSNAAGIGPYRFAYLIERAKSLANLVVQAGNALLLAIEKKESEELTYLRAQQELKLSKANVHLRKLGVIEAEDGLELAERQTSKAQFQVNHLQTMIEARLLPYEQKVIRHLESARTWQIVSTWLDASVTAAQAALGVTQASMWDKPLAVGLAAGVAAAALTSAGAKTKVIGEQTAAQVHSIWASYERRKQEWEFQKGLAQKDISVSEQSEQIASDRIAIAEMEQEIAEMQAEFADQMLEFLKNKFTNKELYVWMVKTLSKILYGFYNLAYTAARMAQATLEFERNETLDFISYGYWDSEKKGLLSGDQLLLDINKLDDHYINNNARKLEITKHVSLSNMAPEALHALISEGKTTFTTSMSWFDRDFPGHYQRIIKSVKVSVLGLIGPTTGMNAMLSTASPSRVILDPLDPVPVDVPRIQSVALSAPSNATGLFELNYRDERYLPFEGSGVDVTWELEMPKASNRFDFNSIVDVIFSIDYTALSDSEYKRMVIEELGTGSGGMLPLSVKNVFPDTWYHFHNPIWLAPLQDGGDPYKAENTPEPYSMKIVVNRSMFPPNEENHLAERMALRLSITDTDIRIPLKRVKFTAENGQIFERFNVRTGEDGYIAFESGIKGLLPFGVWEITINRNTAPESLWKKDKKGQPVMEDITGQISRHVLDTEKITDIIMAITYSAELNWPPED